MTARSEAEGICSETLAYQGDHTHLVLEVSFTSAPKAKRNLMADDATAVAEQQAKVTSVALTSATNPSNPGRFVRRATKPGQCAEVGVLCTQDASKERQLAKHA